MPWFIDCHPQYQPHLDFKRVKALGYLAAIIKVSEGTNFVPPGLKDYVARAQRAGLILGFYHFLDDSPGDRQAEHFVRKVRDLGGVEGRLLVADFEAYGNKSPTNRVLKDFVRGVKRRTNNHAVILYSGYGFWNSGTPSGNARDYDVDAIWDARYADMNRHKYPKAYWRKIASWWLKQPRWGGNIRRIAGQFTSAGRVDGHYMDVNRAFVSKADLLKYTTRGAPIQEPRPVEAGDGLPDYVAKPLIYLEKTKGGPYVPWVSGRFRDGIPAWCENSPPPNPERVEDNGGFCAAMLNLAWRVNGIRRFRDTSSWWAGGVAWWGEILRSRGVLRDYERTRNYPPGTLFIEFYRGAALNDQGHVAIQGRRGKLIQADAFEGVPRPGINEKRTHRETHDLLKRFGGRGWEKTVAPENWLR